MLPLKPTVNRLNLTPFYFNSHGLVTLATSRLKLSLLRSSLSDIFSSLLFYLIFVRYKIFPHYVCHLKTPKPIRSHLILNIPRGVLRGTPLVCYWLTSVEINKYKIFDTNNA